MVMTGHFYFRSRQGLGRCPTEKILRLALRKIGRSPGPWGGEAKRLVARGNPKCLSLYDALEISLRRMETMRQYS